MPIRSEAGLAVQVYPKLGEVGDPTRNVSAQGDIRHTFMTKSGWRALKDHASRIVHMYLRKETAHYGGRYCRRRGCG